MARHPNQVSVYQTILRRRKLADGSSVSPELEALERQRQADLAALSQQQQARPLKPPGRR